MKISRWGWACLAVVALAVGVFAVWAPYDTPSVFAVVEAGRALVPLQRLFDGLATLAAPMAVVAVCFAVAAVLALLDGVVRHWRRVGPGTWRAGGVDGSARRGGTLGRATPAPA